MENLADISEVQVLPNDQKDKQFKFLSIYSVSIGIDSKLQTL